MAQINLSQQQFDRLKRFAEPFVDTPESALDKVLSIAEAAQGLKVVHDPSANAAQPDLTNSTVTSAKVNGTSLTPAERNWNGLLMRVVAEAAGTLQNPAEVSKLIIVNQVPGKKVDVGFKYIPIADLSVQNQSAPRAWKAIVELAKATGVKVEVTASWNYHSKLAGQTFSMSV